MVNKVPHPSSSTEAGFLVEDMRKRVEPPLSQQDLAAKAGITRRHYSRLIHGRSAWEPRVLRRLAYSLGYAEVDAEFHQLMAAAGIDHSSIVNGAEHVTVDRFLSLDDQSRKVICEYVSFVFDKYRREIRNLPEGQECVLKVRHKSHGK